MSVSLHWGAFNASQIAHHEPRPRRCAALHAGGFAFLCSRLLGHKARVVINQTPTIKTNWWFVVFVLGSKLHIYNFWSFFKQILRWFKFIETLFYLPMMLKMICFWRQGQGHDYSNLIENHLTVLSPPWVKLLCWWKPFFSSPNDRKYSACVFWFSPRIFFKNDINRKSNEEPSKNKTGIGRFVRSLAFKDKIALDAAFFDPIASKKIGVPPKSAVPHLRRRCKTRKSNVTLI